MGIIDLHIHTKCSDGTLTPTEVVILAQNKNISTIAITDHDSVDGVEEAIIAGKEYGVKVISGAEFSTKSSHGQIHILGYNFKDVDKIKDYLDYKKQDRENKAREMVRRLNEMGFDISFEKVKSYSADGLIGRPHIAMAMVDAGYATNIKEVFEKYIAYGSSAYVPSKSLTPEETIQKIVEAEGVACWAHPMSSKLDFGGINALVKKYKTHGLKAIEAYYSEYDLEITKKLIEIAEENNLMYTCGTDFHRFSET